MVHRALADAVRWKASLTTQPRGPTSLPSFPLLYPAPGHVTGLSRDRLLAGVLGLVRQLLDVCHLSVLVLGFDVKHDVPDLNLGYPEWRVAFRGDDAEGPTSSCTMLSTSGRQLLNFSMDSGLTAGKLHRVARRTQRMRSMGLSSSFRAGERNTSRMPTTVLGSARMVRPMKLKSLTVGKSVQRRSMLVWVRTPHPHLPN